MSKIDLDPITSGYNLSKINANFQKVEDELNNKVLYRNSPTGEPNSMSSNLDMNGNKILNVVTGTGPSDLATRGYVDEEIAEERVYVDQQLYLVNSELDTKYDKTGGPVFGDINLNGHKLIGASEVQTSKTSTSILEINGVPVVPGNSVIDPYNGTREALRRSYAGAGYNLVDGSFEVGGTLVNANDVLLQESTGKAFSGPAGTVAAGTNPVGGGFVDRSAETLRHKLALNTGAGMVGTSDGRTVQEFADAGASGLPFTALGSGKAQRTVLEKAQDIFSPQDFTLGISGAASNAQSVLIPAGVYPVSSTIAATTTGPYGGGHWRGSGAEWSQAFSARSQNAVSRIRWDGSAGGTLVELDGQLGMSFSDLSFVGRSSMAASNQAGIGMHWRMTGPAGAGESIHTNCSWQYFDVAIQAASTAGEGTCAGLHFVKSTAHYCNTVLQVENNQGLNYVLDHFSANFCDRVAYLKRGGNLQVRGGNFAGCGATNWVFELANLGTAIYANNFKDVRIEQNSKRIIKSVGGSLVVEGMTEAQSNQAVKMFDFQGTKAIIRDSRLITRDSTNPTIDLANQSGGFVGSLTCERVHFDVSSFVLAEWVRRTNPNVHSIITFKGCTYGAAETPIADFSTDTAHGVVPVSVTTTGAVALTLTIFGLPRNHYSVCKIPAGFSVAYEIVITAKDELGATVYHSTRVAVAQNAAGTSTLANTQTVGTNYNPLGLSTQPSVTVTDSYDAIEVAAIGQTAKTISWSAWIRETARVPL